LEEKLKCARERLSTPAENRRVAVRALFCSGIPLLVEDTATPAADAVKDASLSAETADSSQAEATTSNESFQNLGISAKVFMVAEPIQKPGRH
jgi:hypothetical protein